MSGDSGWNAVIHHPSELELQSWSWEDNDGEQERELPSTVDMDAIKIGSSNWDPVSGVNENDSIDSEDDSDSDDDDDDDDSSGGTDDYSSDNSEQTFSIRETNYEQGSLKLKISMKGQKKDDVNDKKNDFKSKDNGKLTKDDTDLLKTSLLLSTPLASAALVATSVTSIPSTSTSSLMTNQIPLTPEKQQTPLQEINQEHLSAIIPDQEDTPFDGFEDSESGRLVSKAIERMSLGADSDSNENNDTNPVPVYSSSLLQQFVEKTALLSEPRKRRSRLVKKTVDNDYPLLSNVSPDSGIQSVDNSPLHLAICPSSPQATSSAPTTTATSTTTTATTTGVTAAIASSSSLTPSSIQTSQSPLQSTKPAVNVDRVLYPPKRKPGRPAKMVTTQPRGPGRPKIKTDDNKINNKLNKNVNTDDKLNNKNGATLNTTTKITDDNNLKKDNNNTIINDKKSSKNSTTMTTKNNNDNNNTIVDKKLSSPSSSSVGKNQRLLKGSKKSKDKQDKTKKDNNNSVKLTDKTSIDKEKCLNKNNINKKISKKNMKNCKKIKNEIRKVVSSSSSRKKLNSRVIVKKLHSKIRKSTKENCLETLTTTTSKKTSTNKKLLLSGSRRVLKENKSSKKISETNVVGVQTIISVPIDLKNENIAVVNKDNNCDKSPKTTTSILASSTTSTTAAAATTTNVRHKTHHHKHRRRLVVPPKKPIKIDPTIIIELEKLIEDFSKSCSLGRSSTNNSNTSELPQIFRVKKITKKRKGIGSGSGGGGGGGTGGTGTGNNGNSSCASGSSSNGTSGGPNDVNTNDEQKLKRRLKKDKLPNNNEQKNNSNSSSNSNEQRLPLKKRHYHLSSPHSSQSSSTSCNETNSNELNTMETHIEEAIEATIERYSTNNDNDNDKIDSTALKKRLRDADNNSDTSDDDKPLNRTEQQQQQQQQPPRRKKKIVRDLRVTVTKLNSDNHHNLTSTINDNKTIANNEKTKDKLNKTDKMIDKLKNDKTINTNDNKKIDKTIVSSKISSDDVKDKDTVVDNSSTTATTTTTTTTSTTTTPLIQIKKKVRRRKAINRTGFPTLKKKKKKIPIVIANVETKKIDNELTLVPRVDVSSVELKNESKIEEKTVLSESDVNGVLPIMEIDDDDDDTIVNNNEEKNDNNKNDFKVIDELSCQSAYSDDDTTDKLRERKDLVDCECNKPCDKLCPVKYEKIQDSRIYDENATLEESLERYNELQKLNELSEENVKKLDRTNSLKLELSNCLINNNNNVINNSNKRRRESSSPCNLTLRSIKRLKNNEYDTESDALPSSDVASDGPDNNTSTKNPSSRKKQPRWKKRYLQAGLYSNFFKTNEEQKKLINTDNNNKSKLIYDPIEHPHGLLPPPIHCGKFLRQKIIDFQLPYDLWWLHTHSKLREHDNVPSWNYRKIRTNIYYDVKPTTHYEAQACECKQDSRCTDDCINKMVFSECSSSLCPCGDKCDNQKIQKHEWSPGLQRFMTESKGWGIKTKSPIENGNFILEYVGEVVSEREFKSRMATKYANDTHHYCLHLDGGLVIDGHRMGGDGRFVNHSCEPNCEMQKWSVHGLPRMALFALRDIKPGEELTYDYNFALFNPSEGQECRCGSDICRGVIGGKSQRVARPSTTPVQLQQTGTNNNNNNNNSNSNNNNTNNNNSNDVTINNDSNKRTVGRPRKNNRKSIIVHSKSLFKTRKFGDTNFINPPTMKPMSNQQKLFAQQHHCFLLRNLEKVRRAKLPLSQLQQEQHQQQFNTNGKLIDNNNKSIIGNGSGDTGGGGGGDNFSSDNNGQSTDKTDAFYSQLTALANNSSRTVRTRRLAQAQDDPEVNKTAKLAKVLKELYTIVVTSNDENNKLLCNPFITLPGKRKLPEYYEKIQEPIDLTIIDEKIQNGNYKTPEQFDNDMIKLFDNNIKYYGRTSEIGISAARLRKLYLCNKINFIDAITEATGKVPTNSFIPSQGSTAGEEDVIRCICGLHRDEGLMIQCERCLVWQHCDCVKADTTIESYLCERCQPRYVDFEIPIEVDNNNDTSNVDDDDKDKKYYVTLLRDDTLQLRQNDTVYVLRDTPDKHTYKTIEKYDYEQMDIFRIERLWKNLKGEKFVFGHHYLRPHETYHEPTRKFYTNEVVCAPLYEAVPCDLIAERCWVLDPHTYCKGRPVGATPEHTYVCEYRVDRAARLFTKVARARHQVCTKPYAFETFTQRIKHYRTYLPHSLEGIQSTKGMKDKKKINHIINHDNQKTDDKNNGKNQTKTVGRARHKYFDNCLLTPALLLAQREKKRKRLNEILTNLLQLMPNKKEPLDMSFLLERNRRNRKRPVAPNP
ncbi:variant-silencing SET domain-containing protein isoform X2 [Aphidius gifuensis]|uniref:variant-silencing SET domain-containing protein isoform X2 n=1 Tax=Aphidius gifuensis TaxID=684658 RepID=UPI001CDBA240|nr:variant-silencing SET domain-containing protein isoform X2 [Aphidius gifuensis]